MKKNFIYATAFAAVVILAACDGPEDTKDLQYSITPTSITGFSGAGGTQTVEIDFPVEWSVSIPAADKWLKAEPSSGSAGKSTVTLTMEPNPDKAERVVRIKVIGGGISPEISISQKSGFTEPSEGINLYGPVFSQHLGVELDFIPFTGVGQHWLVLVDGEGNPLRMVSQGDARDKVFMGGTVDKMGSHTFQYFGYNVDTEYQGGDPFLGMKDLRKSNTHTVKFMMPTEAATLTKMEEGGNVFLKITNVQKGVRSYGIFKDGTLMFGFFMPAEEGQRQMVLESGKYTVRAALGGNPNDHDALFGPPSNEVVVTIAE